MRTEDVLDQIDSAISDWEVGPDAMRCGAPAKTAEETVIVGFDGSRSGEETLLIAGGLTHFRRRWVLPPLDWSIPREATELRYELADVQPWVTVINEWVEQFTGVVLEPWQVDFLDRLIPAEKWDTCVEPQGPAPLCIDGHAYRRRQRNRRAR